MNLGVFFYRGGSLKELREGRHDDLLVNYYFKRYSGNFDNVFIFSYEDEKRELPGNCRLIPNKHRVPLFLYQFLMPVINMKYIRRCDVFRVFHISGTIPAVISRILFGRRYITTYGYLWTQTRKMEKPGRWRSIESIFCKIIEVFGMKFAEKVIVTSSVTERYARKFAGKDKVERIPNSVDTDLFRPRKKEGGKKRVIFIGRFNRIKNIFNLVKAFSGLGKGKRLVLIGDGEDREDIEKLAENLGCKLDFKGVLSHEKVAYELSQSHTFVLPSLSEGQPKVLLEAMSTGIPCIVSDIPSLREIVKDGVNGLLCKTDPNSIRNCMEKVLDNPDFSERIGRNAREFIIKNFSADFLIGKEIKLLKETGKR